MKRSQKRLLLLILAGVPLLLVLSSLGYMFGMSVLEGKERTFWQSFEWAGESLSTTGYGADARWSHPLMVVYVVGIQFVGVFLMYMIIPIMLLPFLEARFEERLPRRVEKSFSNHIVIFRYGPSVETLVDRLKERNDRFVVFERDEDIARGLAERDIPIVWGRDEESALDSCNLPAARALVANGRDEENGALILKARQHGFRGEIYSLVEEPAHRKPTELAGATAAYTPRHILAAALAARASDKLMPRIPGLHQVQGVVLREFRVVPDGGMAGRSLREEPLFRESGISVAGQWVNGDLRTEGRTEMVLEPRAIVLLVGAEDRFEAIEKLDGLAPLSREGPFLIGGFGEVGRKVHELLTDAGDEVLTVDRTPHHDVSVVGNVLDPWVLRKAGVEKAQAVVLALDNDDATLFATVIARETVPMTPIIARVNHARNVENIYRAGADFALSISEVSGQMLSQRLLPGERSVVATHLRIAKVAARKLAGRHPADVGEQLGECSVVAVDRDGELVSWFVPDFKLRENDEVYVCGSDRAVREIGS